MADEHIKKALQETIKEFGELVEKEDELKRQQWTLQRQRFRLMAKVHGLVALCDDIPGDSMIAKLSRDIAHSGLTAAIRNILAGSGEWMSVAQLRDHLIRFRIDLGRYKNPSSSIHTILTRAVENGEVEQKTDPKTKKTVFRQIPPDYLKKIDVPAEAVAEAMLRSRKGKKQPRQTTPETQSPQRLLTEGSSKG